MSIYVPLASVSVSTFSTPIVNAPDTSLSAKLLLRILTKSPEGLIFIPRKDDNMEKIKIGNETFDLIPMGIDISEKSITLTIATDKNSLEVETAFSDVGRIEHLSNEKTLAIYTDGVSLKSVRNNMDGTYTVIIGTDKVEKELAELRAIVNALLNN